MQKAASRIEKVGYIGLGKMGQAQVARLCEKGYRVAVWNRSAGPLARSEEAGAEAYETIGGMAAALRRPRRIWCMVSHGAVDEVLRALVPHLAKGDVVIDGGNSFYRDSMRRAKTLARRGISFLDVGVSGGPAGARQGACLMVGGEEVAYEKCQKLFTDLAAPGACAYLGASGAGHFAKMVHNGIEYGMMQALGEGFAALRRSGFGLDVQKVAALYNRRSVIESRLMGWLAKAFEEHGAELNGISGEVAQSGEGQWFVETARALGVPAMVIEDALTFRIESKGHPRYIGRVLSALRNQFGGHDVSTRGRGEDCANA